MILDWSETHANPYLANQGTVNVEIYFRVLSITPSEKHPCSKTFVLNIIFFSVKCIFLLLILSMYN